MKKKLLAIAVIIFCAFSVADASAEALKIVTFNMGTSKQPVPTMDDVARAVERVSDIPDVVLAQEIPWQVKHDQLAQALGMEYYLSGLELKPYSTRAIFSRTPLAEPQNIVLLSALVDGKQSGSGAGALCATTDIGGKPVLLCSVHLETIREEMQEGESMSDFSVALKYVKNEFLGDNMRSKSVDMLLERLAALDAQNVIIGGDFNTFPLTKAIRKMNAVYEDAFWPSAAFFKGSYVDSPYPINPRIDFIFHSPHMSSRDCKVHDVTSGDHVPVSAVITIPAD